MANLATTKMSSKGQVVIPEDIRNKLNLQVGSQFVVVGERDVVIFKSITQPSMKEFDKLIAKARKQAKKAGLKRSDIHESIAEARGREKYLPKNFLPLSCNRFLVWLRLKQKCMLQKICRSKFAVTLMMINFLPVR